MKLYSEHLRLAPLLRQFFSSSGYSLSAQLYRVALNAGVSQLPQGTFAIYSYIYQIVSKTNGIFLRPISLVFFTKASELATGNRGRISGLSKQALGLFLFSSVPIILFVTLYGEPLLLLLFGIDKIEPGLIALGSGILVIMFALMLFAGIANICRKILLSTGHTESTNWSTSVLQLVSAGIVYLLLPEYGEPGLMLALVFSPLAIALWLVFSVKRNLGMSIFYDRATFARWALVVVATLTSFHWLRGYLMPDAGIESRMQLAIELTIYSAVYGVVVWGLCLAIRVPEVLAFTKKSLAFASNKWN